MAVRVPRGHVLEDLRAVRREVLDEFPKTPLDETQRIPEGEGAVLQRQHLLRRLADGVQVVVGEIRRHLRQSTDDRAMVEPTEVVEEDWDVLPDHLRVTAVAGGASVRSRPVAVLADKTLVAWRTAAEVAGAGTAELVLLIVAQLRVRIPLRGDPGVLVHLREERTQTADHAADL